PGAFQLTDRVGVVRPAHCTALGKVILAALRDDQLRRFLERAELKPSTKRSITQVAALLREIAEVRRTGVAFDEGEFNLDVRCIAVPARDFPGQIVGAIGVSGQTWRESQQALQAKRRAVQAAGAGCPPRSRPRREMTAPKFWPLTDAGAHLSSN